MPLDVTAIIRKHKSSVSHIVRVVGWNLEKWFKVSRVEPAHLVVGGPQFAGLVDINLAGLLRIGLSEFLVDSQRVQSPFENPPFAAEVCRTAQA